MYVKIHSFWAGEKDEVMPVCRAVPHALNKSIILLHVRLMVVGERGAKWPPGAKTQHNRDILSFN